MSSPHTLPPTKGVSGGVRSKGQKGTPFRFLKDRKNEEQVFGVLSRGSFMTVRKLEKRGDDPLGLEHEGSHFEPLLEPLFTR